MEKDDVKIIKEIFYNVSHGTVYCDVGKHVWEKRGSELFLTNKENGKKIKIGPKK